MRTVLFVCTANVCRSPMAEAIFRALSADAGLSFVAHSAGTAALGGEPMTPYAEAALEEIGVDPAGHHARQVAEGVLEGSDLVLGMTRQHVTMLRRLHAHLPTTVETLPGYVGDDPDGSGIADPYGQSMTAFRASARRIYRCAELLLDRLDSQPPY